MISGSSSPVAAIDMIFSAIRSVAGSSGSQFRSSAWHTLLNAWRTGSICSGVRVITKRHATLPVCRRECTPLSVTSALEAIAGNFSPCSYYAGTATTFGSQLEPNLQGAPTFDPGIARRVASFSVGEPLLRHRETVRDGLAPIRRRAHGLGQGPGHLRFRAQSYFVRL